MTLRRTTWLAWPLLACALATLVVLLALAVMNGFERRSDAWGTEASYVLLILLVGVAFASVWREPRAHPRLADRRAAQIETRMTAPRHGRSTRH